MALSVAISGPRSVISGSVASLGATGSGGVAPYSYAWSLSKPAGSTSSLATATGTTNSFTPNVLGAYIVTVTVTDNLSANSTSTYMIVTADTDFLFNGSSAVISLTTIKGGASPVVAPGAPTNVTATAGDGQGIISFTPGSTGNGTVSYTATATPGGQTATGSGSPLTVTGLTNGTSYSFVVTATNSAGSASSSASASVTPAANSSGSTPARYFVATGAAPMVRATYQTAANSPTTGTCSWVGSFASGQAQTAWSIRLDDMTTNTTGVYTKSGSGAAESTTLNTTLTAGHAYKAWVTITQTDGQSSTMAGTRFVVPSGRTVYLESYGAVGNGSTSDSTAFMNALKDLAYGDTLKSNKPGLTFAGASASGTSLSLPAGGLLSAHVGKPIIIYGAGSFTYGSAAALQTTISAVAGDGKSATLASSVTTAVTGAKIMVDFPTYLIGHIDVDPNHGPGGYTIDLTGCLCTSSNPNSAGFNTRLSDVSYIGVHYKTLNVTSRGNGQNNLDGTFFADGSTFTVVGLRFMNCYSETAHDAGYLFYNGVNDIHVVDCINDHSFADSFHVTGGAYNVQFIRPLAIYPGDDGFANVGYLNAGASGEPYNITWESPTLHNQDWGRGLSAIGCHDILYTDISLNGTADAAIYLGQEGNGTMDTHRVQIRRGTITNPNYRRGQSHLTGDTSENVQNRPWLLLLSGQSSYQQSDLRLESLTCTDGRYIQIIRYGSGTYKDTSIVVTGITMNGSVNAGASWLDDSTWPQHIDMTDIAVPAGSTSAPAASNAGTNGGN